MSSSEHRPLFPTGPLYKYLSTSPEQSPSWKDRFENILSGQAFLSSPVDFNDPFDCAPYVTIPGTWDEIEAQTANLAVRMADSLPGMPVDYVAAKLVESLPKFGLDGLQKVVGDSVSKTSSEMGVFCLAERIDNVLMWSHYANNHQGFAVRFDIAKQLRGGLMPMSKVVYQHHRPNIGNLFSGLDHDEIPNALATKAAFWEYEGEWRSIRPKSARTFLDFDPRIITGVVFGARCPDDHRSWITNRVQGQGIELLEIQPALQTFDLSAVVIK